MRPMLHGGYPRHVSLPGSGEAMLEERSTCQEDVHITRQHVRLALVRASLYA
jgi:hypothetical protein